MPWSCWPCTRKQPPPVSDSDKPSNGVFRLKDGITNSSGNEAKKDEMIIELNQKNETLKRIANEATNNLKTLERMRRDLERQLEERDNEIRKLKEILASIRPTEPTSINRDRRAGVDGGKVEAHVNAKKNQKSLEQKKFLKRAIQSNDFLKNLSDEQINEMIDYIQRSFPPNGVFIKEGTKGDRLYILESGELEVTQGNKFLNTLKPNTVFGELALLYNCKRTATVTAKTPTKIWMLERNVFQMIMMNTANTKRGEITQALKKVSLMKTIGKGKIGKLADALEEEIFQQGDYIVRQGEIGDTFYIVMEGNVDVTELNADGASLPEIFKRTLGKGDYFGEAALRNESGKRGANVIAKSNVVKCMTLEKKPFLSLIGDRADKNWDSNPQHLKPYLHLNISKSSTASISSNRSKSRLIIDQPRKPKASAILDLPRRRMHSSFESVTVNDFETIGVLGVGGFGRVKLVKRRGKDDRSYALKCMKKTYIVETKQQDHIYSEKNIMRDSDNPFIVQLYRTFKDDKYVYMLMEACLGGELWAKLRDDGYFEEKRARFYAACVIEAVEYLHLHGVVYRDLKPENLLLDKRGYVKLVDFGFAKTIDHGEKTWTFCGTPEYVAPEVILNKGHDVAVDYWALGILIFEMLTGNPPFHSSDAMKTYRMALRGIDSIEWPQKVSKVAQNLIRRLCRENQTERLGNLRDGINDIKGHRWFSGFAWTSLRNGEIKAPYVPEITSTNDLRNFDSFELEDDAVEIELSGWDKDF
ncbi:cGMP-dependent protein kinase 1-like isoform X2 [Clavelina lepadiformis]|uniref:cGMP-dependent protein kinase n=1 Tax=Clavelina lepadiformis TaxID=159417 RepID=A0ABP0F2R4_CLALP